MKAIEINGKEFKVIDNLGCRHGRFVKEVSTEDGPKMVTSGSARGPWRFHVTKVLPRGAYVGQ